MRMLVHVRMQRLTRCFDAVTLEGKMDSTLAVKVSTWGLYISKWVTFPMHHISHSADRPKLNHYWGPDQVLRKDALKNTCMTVTLAVSRPKPAARMINAALDPSVFLGSPQRWHSHCHWDRTHCSVTMWSAKSQLSCIVAIGASTLQELSHKGL